MSLMPLTRVLLVSLMLAITFSSCVKQPLISEKPNVIIIFADDLGYNDLGVFNGNRTLTPHIDALITDGIFLSNYYTYKVCSPSRASIMSAMSLRNTKCPFECE